MKKATVYIIISALLYALLVLYLIGYWDIEGLPLYIFVFACSISFIAALIEIRDWGFFLCVGLLISALIEDFFPKILPAGMNADFFIYTFVTAVIGLTAGFLGKLAKKPRIQFKWS